MTGIERVVPEATKVCHTKTAPWVRVVQLDGPEFCRQTCTKYGNPPHLSVPFFSAKLSRLLLFSHTVPTQCQCEIRTHTGLHASINCSTMEFPTAATTVFFFVVDCDFPELCNFVFEDSRKTPRCSLKLNFPVFTAPFLCPSPCR